MSTEIKVLSWWVETDIRPAPILLACLSALFVVLSRIHPLRYYFLGFAVLTGLLCIQITIWRAAQMITRGGVELNERQQQRVREMESF